MLNFMDEQDIKEVLEVILSCLQDGGSTWRLEGSANLRVQGVDVPVRDLDITTSEDGIGIFREALGRFIVKDFFDEKINAYSIVCDINNFEIEINSYNEENLGMFDKIEKIQWNGLQIPILPIEYAREFYRLINRREKVDLISRHLCYKM